MAQVRRVSSTAQSAWARDVSENAQREAIGLKEMTAKKTIIHAITPHGYVLT